ncbi:hypothetical protein AAG570_008789 [Ranatra chinensis]|uniref:Uncharacterized protein n=1 Tax=Ranatra chinensis TaxID=642074 RepID=A0ABD0Z4T1_9HEMI
MASKRRNMFCQNKKQETTEITEFFKCYDREAITCEQYLRVPLDNICEFINAKNQFWTPVFQSFQPRFPCPDFVPGTYKLANGSFDLNELMKVVGHLPDSELYDFYWKQRLEFFNKRERLTCVYYVMKLDKVKANF